MQKEGGGNIFSSMNKKSVIVFGATGFIGRHLVERLLEEKCAVTIVIRSTSQIPEEWKKRITCITCDSFDAQGLALLFKDKSFDIIYNLAAYGVKPQDRDITLMRQINHELPPLLVQFATFMNAAVISAGSASEYYVLPTQTDEPITEMSPLEPAKLYGTSKATGGLMAHALALDKGICFAHLRLFNVYGVGESAYRLVPALIQKLSRGEALDMSEGTQVRDFIHVSDVIEAFIAAATYFLSLDKPVAAIWNVCTGQGTSVRALAETMADLLGVSHTKLNFGAIPMRPDDIPWIVGDATHIKKATGWQARFTIKDGLNKVIAEVAS